MSPADRPPAPLPQRVLAGQAGLLALTAALTLYRFWLVAHSGITLFLDEAQYWDWSRELAWGYYSKPPVIAWLIAASTAAFGDGLLGVKAAGMLLYPITTLVVWDCGRAMFGPAFGARAGWAAALCFVTSPLVALLGLFVSTDAPLLLAWAAATWAGWLALGPGAPGDDRPRWGAWVALGFALGLGLLSKYTMAAIVPGLLWALWHWRARGVGADVPVINRRRWLGAALTSAITLAWLLPHALWNLRMGAPTLRHTVEITAEAQRGGGGLAGLGEFVAGQALILGPLATAALLCAAWRLWRRRRATAAGGNALTAGHEPIGDPLRYLLALALPLLGLAALQAANANANVNWAAPAYVSAVLLLGRVLTRPDGLRRGWLSVIVVFNLAVVALVTQAADIAHLTGRPLPAKLDAFARMRGYDRAYATLRPAVQARPGWLVVSDDRSLLAQAAYQWRDLGVQPLAWNPLHHADNHYELSTDLGSKVGSDVIYLITTPLPPEVQARFESLDEVQQTRVEVAPGRLVTVRLYALRGFLGYR
jgi:4-amino-4-deoxy-L-arabinose transferase-like glycosyltransferase